MVVSYTKSLVTKLFLVFGLIAFCVPSHSEAMQKAPNTQTRAFKAGVATANALRAAGNIVGKTVSGICVGGALVGASASLWGNTLISTVAARAIGLLLCNQASSNNDKRNLTERRAALAVGALGAVLFVTGFGMTVPMKAAIAVFGGLVIKTAQNIQLG